eukprot:2587204-Rhodomonas_salina.1
MSYSTAVWITDDVTFGTCFRPSGYKRWSRARRSRGRRPVLSSRIAMRCAVLTSRMAMRCAVLTSRMGRPVNNVARQSGLFYFRYSPPDVPVRYQASVGCYLPGTDGVYVLCRVRCEPRAARPTILISNNVRFSHNEAGPLSPYAHAMQCPVLTSCMGLSAYARAIQCPVLTLRMCLRACYGSPGTDLGYGPTRRGGHRHFQYLRVLQVHQCLRAMALRARSVLSESIALTVAWPYALPGTDIGVWCYQHRDHE